jgi:hypothetical protein
MRTTIRLDDQLFRQAKRAAAEKGKTLTALVEESLRLTLLGRPGRVPHKRIKLVTHGSGGVAPGVDLDDSAALLDLMEETDGPLRR